MPSSPGFARGFFSSLAQTFRFWMRTEVHAYAFSVAANVLLSFFPFLIVTLSLSSIFFNRYTTLAAIDLALRDYFPANSDSFSRIICHRSRHRRRSPSSCCCSRPTGFSSRLEVALNHVWGIHKNRSFLRNQLVSLTLIFACGGLALFSLWLGALERRDGRLTADGRRPVLQTRVCAHHDADPVSGLPVSCRTVSRR